MGKKRKSVATSLDEVDRTMFSSFCTAANSLSQLYTQAMNQQKLSFQAGERSGLGKLRQWIARQQESGSRISLMDVLSHLQSELDNYGEEPSISTRTPTQQLHPHLQPPMQHLTSTGYHTFSGSSGVEASPAQHGLEVQTTKNSVSVFSNGLTSPFRRSLPQYQLAHGVEGYTNLLSQPVINAPRSHELDPVQHIPPLGSFDSSMDMYQD